MTSAPASKRPLRVASVQMECAPGDKAANFSKIELWVARAASQDAGLILLPECCVTGYWFIRNPSVPQLAAPAEPVPDGPSIRRLSDLARRHQLTAGAGLIEAAEDGAFYNTFGAALPNGVIHRYCSDSRSLQPHRGRDLGGRRGDGGGRPGRHSARGSHRPAVAGAPGGPNSTPRSPCPLARSVTREN